MTSILSNPDQDPHLFEVSPSVGRALSAARDRHLQRHRLRPLDGEAARRREKNSHRKTIVVADLVGKKTGDNPHVWYDLTADAGARQVVGRRLEQRSIRRIRPIIRVALGAVSTVAAADPGQDRATASASRRHAGHRDRADLRLYVRRAGHCRAAIRSFSSR